jgi:hypothetical protein
VDWTAQVANLRSGSGRRIGYLLNDRKAAWAGLALAASGPGASGTLLPLYMDPPTHPCPFHTPFSQYQYHQFQIVGRHLPTEKDAEPQIYRMKLWARDDVKARSKFW